MQKGAASMETGSVKIKRYYAKNGRLILTAKRGKEIKQIHCTIHCNSSNRYIVIQIQIHALCKYIVFILISLLFYFFSSLRRGDQSTVFCIVSFSRHSPAHCNNLVIKLVYNTPLQSTHCRLHNNTTGTSETRLPTAVRAKGTRYFSASWPRGTWTGLERVAEIKAKVPSISFAETRRAFFGWEESAEGCECWHRAA